ncbi:MAG: hypothetical protein AB1641_09830 [Thermodesulfobacteriota bacterium]
MGTIRAFIDGYRYGRKLKKDMTPREANKVRPGYNHKEIDVFLNGLQDALIGDDYRYRLAQRHLAEGRED